ncbi:hypothetical protein QUF76_19090 [Desulfobacterales bacterium HSG16]|nr:hypothetical protein [Desulfobacterales bacterium HSG16]
MDCDGVFNFQHSDKIYKDHFPGAPVVPGSLIIHAFLNAASEIWGCPACGIEKFKFRRFVSPGRYNYLMEQTALNIKFRTIKCTLFDKRKVAVTGIIKIKTDSGSGSGSGLG